MYGIQRNDIDTGAIVPSKLGTELKRMSKVFNVGDVAADSDAIKVPLFAPPRAITLKKAMLGVDTAITAADTNYQTVALTDGTNTIASLATGPAATGEDMAAGVLEEITLDSDYIEIAAGDQLCLEFTKTGTGMAMSGLVCQIDYEVDDPN